MTTESTSPLFSPNCARRGYPRSQSASRLVPVALAVGIMLLFSGCEAVPTATSAPEAAAPQAAATASSHDPEALTLKEGDTLRISFPGVPSMDTTQQVRQDGRINLPMLGEQVVAGKTTDGLTKELVEMYASKLVSKEVMVTLISSSFPVYVTGAVVRPGKILADRPISAFEAIMEAGGFDKARANLTAVVIIRQENGQTKNYTVNLQSVLEGKSGTPFMLKRADTLYVPEKFSWF